MTPQQLENLVNPLNEEDIQSLQEVDRIAEAAHSLLAKAELAGVDVSADRRALTELQQQARGLVAAFGGGIMEQPQPVSNPEDDTETGTM